MCWAMGSKFKKCSSVDAEAGYAQLVVDGQYMTKAAADLYDILRRKAGQKPYKGFFLGLEHGFAQESQFLLFCGAVPALLPDIVQGLETLLPCAV